MTSNMSQNQVGKTDGPNDLKNPALRFYYIVYVFKTYLEY